MKKTVQSFWEVHQQFNVLDTVEKDFTKGFAFLNLAKIGFQLPFQSSTIRPDYFSFLIVKKGNGICVIDENSHSVEDNTIHFTNMNVYRSFSWSVITQDFSQKQARIYIAEGTTVTGLQPIQNITLIYLEKSEKIKQNLAKNRSKAERKTVQQAPNKETAVPKEIIKESNDQNIFLFSTNCTTAVAPTTTQNIKLLAFIPKEVKNNITTTNSSKKSSFERRNLLKLSICLTVNSIRPPPFI